MSRITKLAPLFEGFVKEKEYSALLENINESVDTEIAEKYKKLSSEKEAAEAINELIDKKVSLEEFFATMSELKQDFKPKSGTELSDELTKALNRMTDTYKLLSEKNREIGRKIVEKIKGKPAATKAPKAPEKKVNESTDALNEGVETYVVKDEEEDAIQYIKDALDDEFPEEVKFNIVEFGKEHDLNPRQVCIAICNLEDSDVMKDIINGDYDSFDLFDEDIFNDEYRSVVKGVMKAAKATVKK
jgi:hypothetical protein